VILLLSISATLAAAPAIAPAPDRAQAYYHFSLAQQSRLAGEVEEALAEYRKAIRIDSGSAALHSELARMLRESGRAAEALVEAETAVRIDPADADAHLVLAQVLQSNAEGEGGEDALKKAAAAYEQALKIRPADTITVLTLAHVYGQLAQHADAVRMWNRYLEFDPASFDAYLMVSPSLWYDRHLPRRWLRDHGAALDGVQARVYGGVGAFEHGANGSMPADLADFFQALSALDQPGLCLRQEALDGEPHHSVYPRALSNGLRFLWGRRSGAAAFGDCAD
jgi:tetratricopeptide (TPR) repeat protein